MAQETKTTRFELIETKKAIKLAIKGHSLLKQKRDILVLEFFKILKKAKDLREELNGHQRNCFSSLAIAQAYDGLLEVESASRAVKKAPGVIVTKKNVMGVQIPEIRAGEFSKNLLERGYPIIGSSARIDECATNFEKSLAMVIKLAETENSLKRLIKEIEKTKRRVNALDYILMPRLNEKARYISFRLEEIEREQFISLRAIKEKLESRS